MPLFCWTSQFQAESLTFWMLTFIILSLAGRPFRKGPPDYISLFAENVQWRVWEKKKTGIAEHITKACRTPQKTQRKNCFQMNELLMEANKLNSYMRTRSELRGVPLCVCQKQCCLWEVWPQCFHLPHDVRVRQFLEEGNFSDSRWRNPFTLAGGIKNAPKNYVCGVDRRFSLTCRDVSSWELPASPFPLSALCTPLHTSLRQFFLVVRNRPCGPLTLPLPFLTSTLSITASTWWSYRAEKVGYPAKQPGNDIKRCRWGRCSRGGGAPHGLSL